MSPMVSGYAAEDGSVSERQIDYYAERARGGVGLIVVENRCIDWKTGRALAGC